MHQLAFQQRDPKARFRSDVQQLPPISLKLTSRNLCYEEIPQRVYPALSLPAGPCHRGRSVGTRKLFLYIGSHVEPPKLKRQLRRSAAARIAMGQQQLTLKAERVNLRSAQRDRSVTHGARRVAYVPGGSRRALENRSGAALSIRSPPHEAWASPCLWLRDSRRRVSSESRQISLRRSMIGLTPQPPREPSRLTFASSSRGSRF